MKQQINYITHHKAVNIKMMEDDLTSTHISLYNALFLIWNECCFDTELSVNRNDVMKLSKIGSANTYTKALKDLDVKGYLKYSPSHNPLIGSKINLYRFDKTTDNSTDNSSVKSSSNSTDNSSDTLYKLLNSKTIKLLNDNAALVNDNLQKWIDYEIEKSKPKEELSNRDMIFKKWFDYRKQIKKPLKDVSIESLKSTWSSKSDEDLKLIIEQSISNGWQGLFELKQQPHQQSTFQQSKLPNSVYFDPAPDEAAERRLRSQVNMFTDKVKKDYVLGVNYTEDQLQDYLEKNVKNYKRP